MFYIGAKIDSKRPPSFIDWGSTYLVCSTTRVYAFVYYIYEEVSSRLCRPKTESPTTFMSSSISSKQLETVDLKEPIIDCLRNQMLITNLEKLQKFSGKSKQNVSKWLREIDQTMNMFKLTDNEKLFYISLCLEVDA